jgi:hypothetical protein
VHAEFVMAQPAHVIGAKAVARRQGATVLGQQAGGLLQRITKRMDQHRAGQRGQRAHAQHIGVVLGQ